MNREEAKNKVMTIYGSLSEEMKQAIDVLVDAPKSEWEQMGELINRQAVLAYIDCLQYSGWGGWGLFEHLREHVKKMPSEEGQEWIPVIEKMPENGKEVLFCDIDEDVMIGYHVKGRAETHFTQCDTYEDMKNVKAWMPLPAPYKQEGN